MSEFRIGIVGTGPNPDEADHDGYSMGYRHARSYRKRSDCRIVGCTENSTERASAFGDEFDLPNESQFTDVGAMLEAVRPDIVSICTPPSPRPELVEECARHDAVQAIHCEKPLATTFGESRGILETCTEHDVQLTVNLQYRCSDAAAEIKSVIDDGAIGDLQRVEVTRRDLLQTGLHNVDVANFVLDDDPVEWVLGQFDYPGEQRWYTDMHSEAQSVGMWEYESGVIGLCSTGAGEGAVGGSGNRFVGTDGEIEFPLGDHYEIRTDDGDGWRTVDVDGNPVQDRAIEAVVAGLDRGETPPHRGETALAATEIVFAIWESARRRGRVELPLQIDDNPLASLVEAGELPPNAEK